MQVDRNNFLTLLPKILQHITYADFLSFDCQFSGLITCLERIEGAFPNHIQFYQRIKETANNFALFQVGITAFIWNGQQYIPKVYNFYLEPKSQAKGRNKIMLCQVQSMQFLAKNGMDFKRVFTQGIASKRLKNEYENHPKTKSQQFSYKKVFFSEKDQKMVDEIQQQLKVFFNNEQKQTLIDFKNKAILLYFRNKTEEAYIIQKNKNVKSFQCLVVKYQKTTYQAQKQSPMKVKQPTVEYGFEIVIKNILENMKPLVGHFPNLDIGLIYAHFIDQLPEKYQDFCSRIQELFPFIYDTKVISKRIQNKIKSIKVDLSSLFMACFNDKQLKKYTNINFSQCTDYLKSEAKHEAGYDSFITGCAFIGMANFILNQRDRINFMYLHEENKILFSKFTGEVRLLGFQGYCKNSQPYKQTILISDKLSQQDKSNTAKILSQFGSLSILEDHQQVYYVFEKQQNIQQIRSLYAGLKLRTYDQRKIIKHIQTFKSDN